VDASIYESVLSVMENLITEYVATGYQRERSGAILPGIAPSNAYPTASGDMVVIGANQDTLFERLTEAMGQPDLAERYKGHAARGQNQTEIDALISAWTATQETQALLKLMDERGVAAGLIYKAADMLEDPQYLARQSIVEVPHPAFGTVKMQNTFPMLSHTPGEVRWPGPPLGAHTDEVLRNALGLDSEAVAGLRSRGVI
jgi:formyl-CoA transferase